jgi:hypothetical protein
VETQLRAIGETFRFWIELTTKLAAFSMTTSTNTSDGKYAS